MEQYEWAENGNIRPCPYKDNCRTYMIGCDGQSYWCNNGEVMRKEADNDKIKDLEESGKNRSK